MKMNEEQLVSKCLERDSLAQKQLFDFYYKRMMGVCLRYAKDTEDAQDILQMGFIKVFEKLDLYKHQGSLEGWIRKVIVNTALDNIRRNKKLMNNIELDKVDYQLYNNDENVIDSMSAEDLLQVIQAMPPGFRAVFNLFVIEGFSHKEIAEKLNISVSTSKSQFSRARVFLQKKLKQQEII